jgi:hypothetical protein
LNFYDPNLVPKEVKRKCPFSDPSCANPCIEFATERMMTQHRHGSDEQSRR